jgi:hypothetical protein
MVPASGIAANLKTIPSWVWFAAGIGLLIIAGPEIKQLFRRV